MLKKLLLLPVLFFLLLVGCTTDEQEEQLLIANTNTSTVNDAVQQEQESLQPDVSTLEGGQIQFAQAAGGATCRNVVIINGYAYAACDNQILIGELETGTITSLDVDADDITADAERGLFFTQSGTSIRMYIVKDPTAPVEVASATANFGLFSGISAAGCTLAVSGGVGGSNTRVFVYSLNDLSLQLTENGITPVDNVTGTPDVHVAVTNPGEITAFYSQDIGAVANWAIQPAVFNGSAQLQSTPERTVLTQGSFGGPFGEPFGPANFPVESEYLNGRLYVAHFAATGVEVIDVASGSLLSPFALPYEPTNIGTDGTSLFVVGVSNNEVDVLDPESGNVIESLGNLDEPTGVAASSTHIAVADQTLGLVIITRT